MIWIVNQFGLLVEEYCSSFFESNAVLLCIGSGFDVIPFELQRAHAVVYLHRIYDATPATDDDFQIPNVRAKRATPVGRQARAGENVHRTTSPGLVACRWRSA
jgi:hypothetical protein